MCQEWFEKYEKIIRETKKCEYCEKEKWLSEYNNGHGIYIQNYYNNPIIVVDHANIYDEIDINYCPMCRKKVRR